jgi:hypothetical protein
MADAGLPQRLREELEAGRAFVALLEQERAELATPAPERLAAIAERKIALAGELSRLARERGAPPFPDDAGRGVLDELVACARRARELMHANAALLDLRLRAVGEALAVLLQPGSGPAEVYAPDGRWRPAPVRSPRAKA